MAVCARFSNVAIFCEHRLIGKKLRMNFSLLTIATRAARDPHVGVAADKVVFQLYFINVLFIFMRTHRLSI